MVEITSLRDFFEHRFFSIEKKNHYQQKLKI